ncbi:MAG: LysM peptidoglycan-binding domain-containing protein, partial [Anaerolineae bacterium]|nr:LysM peptidoglycan-binding domain-containing protein [Anaerolineae bacterium]
MSENPDAGTGRPVGLGQLVGGLAITLISLGMLLGAFLLSQLGVSSTLATPTPMEAASRPTATPFLPTLVSPSPTSTPTSTPTPSPTEETVSPTTPTPSATPTPIPTAIPTLADHLLPRCLQPAGWFVYTVQQGDTLPALAWRSGMTTYALMQANCLISQVISPGQKLYVPPTFYATATPRPYRCGPPLGWTYLYRVQPGDTLYALSRRFGVGIEAIRQANCLSGYQINIGQVLYMPQPPLYTSTPYPTATFTPTPTPTSTLAPTLTSTATPTLTPTGSPPPTLTYTPVPTVIPTTPLTPTVTFTPVPTSVFTETPTLTPTLTETPVAPTSTFTPIPTLTPEPATATFTPAPTEIPVPTETPTP